MKNDKLSGFDILDINIKKSFKYQVASFSGAFMHLTFLIIFTVIKLYTMVVFNVFSVVLYTVLGLFCEKAHFENHAFRWITAMYSEVSVHSILCTFFLGGNTCFFLYSVMSIPVVIYYLFLTCSNKVFKRGTIVFSLITLSMLTAALLFQHYNEPLYVTFVRPLTGDEVDFMRAVNIIFNMLLLFGFSILFVLEIHSLIKQLNETNEQLHFTATHDALTGLYNRHCLHSTLRDVAESTEPFCVVMGDIDDFKKINDTFGHDCGDVVLRSVAEIIMRNIGENDIACRWGGEEMLMILHGTYDECYPKISKIKSEINALCLDHENRAVKVSMTFGFATSAENADIRSEGIDAMLSMVDKRLYKGKASGKNIIVA